MSVRMSPTARRRRLAAELRRLRKEAGLTREQVAEAIACAPATVTRIESAQSGIRVGEAKLMLELYGVTGSEREALLEMAKYARRRGWWHRYSGAIPAWFQTYVSLEEEAVTIRAYESEAVPGLFQTEGYARAMLLSEPIVPDEDEIERRVAVRIGRQHRLSGDDPVTSWVILNESVLHRRVGDNSVMREQLKRLEEISQYSSVTVQVLPFTAGAHPAMDGAFSILKFSERADPDVVYVEYRAGSLYLEGQAEVDGYILMFDHLRARALGPDESRALIAKVAADLA